MIEPTLPHELEREIFEFCALSHPPSIASLMLVAWRVNLWVEPLLYRTLVLSQYGRNQAIQGHPRFHAQTLAHRIESYPDSSFRDSVRNLFTYQMDTDHEALILSACSKIENLWIITDAPGHLYPLIRTFPLKRLHCSLEALFSSIQPDFTLPLFSHITHLEWIDFPSVANPETWSGLALIPNLTHLSFNSPTFIPLWPGLLATCESLRVLVFLWGVRGPKLVAEHQDGENLARDTRFVVMGCDAFVKDWQKGAHAGLDYWRRAEDFIAKRRSGEIDVLQYAITEDESESIDS
ncbi:hypothetical protein DFH09DRAFT_603549 [Mycena vulgaris]|nr:hypothetical protein DFH09DRAFT_603549 [Mycena vulgaris]